MSVTKSCTHLYQIDDKCFLLLVVGCQEKQASSVPFDQHFTEGGRGRVRGLEEKRKEGYGEGRGCGGEGRREKDGMKRRREDRVRREGERVREGI